MLYTPERLSQNQFLKKKLGIGGTTVFHMVSIGILLFSEIQLQVLSEASDLAAYHAQARSESRWGALLCELCAVVHLVWGDVGGGTMWQTQTSTYIYVYLYIYISTYVECILRNHTYKNHRALFQKPNSMNWMDCFQKSSRIEFDMFDGLWFATFLWNWSVLGWSIFWHPRTWCQSPARTAIAAQVCRQNAWYIGCFMMFQIWHKKLTAPFLDSNHFPMFDPIWTNFGRPRMVHGGVGFALRHQGTSSGCQALWSYNRYKKKIYSYLWYPLVLSF